MGVQCDVAGDVEICRCGIAGAVAVGLGVPADKGVAGLDQWDDVGGYGGR